MPNLLQSILTITLFLIPGYIAARITFKHGALSQNNQHYFILVVALMGMLNHLVCYPYTASIVYELSAFYGVIKKASPATLYLEIWNGRVFWWFVFAVFVLPIILGLIFSFMLTLRFMQPLLNLFGLDSIQRTTQAWDLAFTRDNGAYWIIARLKDGSVVGGYYGKKSFVSLSPYQPDIFLETEYQMVNEGVDFGDKIPYSKGVWVKGDQIHSLHFYRVEIEGEGDVQS